MTARKINPPHHGSGDVRHFDLAGAKPAPESLDEILGALICDLEHTWTLLCSRDELRDRIMIWALAYGRQVQEECAERASRRERWAGAAVREMKVVIPR